MSKYVDGFVIPVPEGNVEKYREIARKAGEIWMEHGALSYFETVGDDLDVEKVVSFKQLAGARDGETVVFAWIVYESKEARDRVNAAVMVDERMKDEMGGEMPFDMKRMAYGGFETLVGFSK